jgi:NAD(P)-dependent dehydrogenase (short-subunit alcohol dehydrogenase family)
METWGGVAGKRVVITGATNGIGLAASTELARRGAQLAIVARTADRADQAVRVIQAAAGDRTVVEVMLADLSSQASVRRLANEALERYPRIEVLINNAGAVHAATRLTEDGIELTWAVNHLAPFLFTTLLLDRIKTSTPARIVTTASGAHEAAQIPFDEIDDGRAWGRAGFKRYGETKLANILFTTELARRLEGSGVTANAFHPGFVATGFNKNNSAFMRFGMTVVRPFARSAQRGARTLVWLVDSEEAGEISGGYFFDESRVTPSAAAQDAAAARRLWELSEDQTRASATRTSSI